MRTDRLWSPVAALAAASLLLPAACGGATSGPAGGGGGAPGKPEQGSVTIAVPYQQAQIYSMFYPGLSQGYFRSEGLDIKVVVTQDVRAAVIGGSAAIGMDFIGNVAQAAAGQTGVRVVGGMNCRTPMTFAVGPGIQRPSDLEGRDVLVTTTAGDPQTQLRLRVLKEAGWDVAASGAHLVNVPGGSAAWAQLLVAGKLALVPVYDTTRGQVVKGGGRIIVDRLLDVPAYVLFATKDWIDGHPNTLEHFLRAEIRTLTYETNLGNQDAIIRDLKTRYGVNVGAAQAATGRYKLVQEPVCANMYFDEQAYQRAAQVQKLPRIPFSELASLDALRQAQRSLGLSNTLPPAPPYP
jgi:NitT/TauT family transport system substrate-binding protein